MTFQERIDRDRERQNNLPAANNNDADQNGFDAEFFGIDNIKSFPACLDLRLSEGIRKAVPYSYITEINYDPPKGIELTTTTKKIVIVGRDLERLFDYLASFRVRYIKAYAGTDGEENGLFVKEILIEEI